MPQSRPISLLLLCGASLIFLVVGATALILSNLRDRAMAEGERQLQSSASILAKIAGRDFQAVELVETNLIEQMETAAIVSRELFASAMTGHDVHTMLQEKISGFPCVDAVLLVGADGKLINSSRDWPVMQVDVSGEGYFRTLTTSLQLTSMLSAPARDPRTGNWTIYLAHKFIGADGELLGLVVAAIKTQYFEEFYRTLTRVPSDSIALFRADGIMLARYPHHEELIGKSFADKALYRNVLSHADMGLVRQIAKTDGQDRLVAGARLAGPRPMSRSRPRSPRCSPIGKERLCISAASPS